VKAAATTVLSTQEFDGVEQDSCSGKDPRSFPSSSYYLYGLANLAALAGLDAGPGDHNGVSAGDPSMGDDMTAAMLGYPVAKHSGILEEWEAVAAAKAG
jgi:hypothetical protein